MKETRKAGTGISSDLLVLAHQTLTRMRPSPILQTNPGMHRRESMKFFDGKDFLEAIRFLDVQDEALSMGQEVSLIECVFRTHF